MALLIQSMTDNRNRTVAEIRHLFSKNGGNLGESGSVGWMFEKKGYIVVDKAAKSEEELLNSRSTQAPTICATTKTTSRSSLAGCVRRGAGAVKEPESNRKSRKSRWCRRTTCDSKAQTRARC